MEGKGTPPRFKRAALALGIVLLFGVPAKAEADGGQLTFADCLTSDTNVAVCAPVPGATAGGFYDPLTIVHGLASSPDGNNVYAVTSLGDSVVTFGRSAADGALAFADCITSNSGQSVCTEIAGSVFGATDTGLAGLRAVTLSPDGTSLYTASESGDAVARFNRDPATGSLAYQGCFSSDTAVTGCTQITGATAGGTNSPLNGLRSLVVSPDGAHLYAASAQSDAVSTFSRDLATGALTYQRCQTSNTTVAACPTVNGAVAGGTNTPLESLYSVEISPDGRSVYTAAYDGHAIARFERAADGVLTFRDCLTSSTAVTACAPVPGATANGENSNLFTAISIVVSADGRNAYVAGEYAGTLTSFDRDPATGALTQRECFTSDTNQGVCTDLPGAAAAATDTIMQYPEQVAASADGRSVYVASYSATVLRFDRDPATGALTYRDCLNSDTSIGGCTSVPGATANGSGSPFSSASSIVVSPDGRNVYAGSEGADAVSRLNRELPPPNALPANDFAFGKLKRNKRKGTAKLTVKVPGPGALELDGKSLKDAARQATAAGDVKLLVKAKGKGAKKLRKRGKLKVRAQVTFTPTGGEPNTESKRVKLIRKR